MRNKEAIEKIKNLFRTTVYDKHGRSPWVPYIEDELDELARKIHAVYTSLGYVQKAEDQSLPETPIDEMEYGDAVCHDFRWGVHCAQQDMLTPDKDGCVWVRIKLPEKE